MTESKREDLRYGRHQLIFETVRQSLEEAAEGFCTRVEIMLLPDGRVRIRDNGRGLPLSEDIQADRMVLNKILAGKPVTNAEYSQMGDLVQAGMQTVNSCVKACRLWYTGTAEASSRVMWRGLHSMSFPYTSRRMNGERK